MLLLKYKADLSTDPNDQAFDGKAWKAVLRLSTQPMPPMECVQILFMKLRLMYATSAVKCAHAVPALHISIAQQN